MPDGVDIYSLSDPLTGEVRYIGKARYAARRFASHLRDSRHRNTPVYLWIRELASQGCVPTMAVIERTNAVDWPDREKQLIASHRASNARLLNVAAGGNEPHCPRHIRAANGRAVASTRNKRLWKLRRDLGQALKDGYVSEVTKEKMRSRPDVFAAFAAYL